MRTKKPDPLTAHYQRLIKRMVDKLVAEYKVPRPAMEVLVYPNRFNSSGTTYYEFWRTRITLRLGCIRPYGKHVIVHELAHVLTPGQAHNAVFYGKFKELLKFYGMPIREAYRLESNYKPRNSKTLLKRTKVAA